MEDTNETDRKKIITLLKRFGSVAGIREAEPEELEKVIGKKKAGAVWSALPE